MLVVALIDAALLIHVPHALNKVQPCLCCCPYKAQPCLCCRPEQGIDLPLHLMQSQGCTLFRATTEAGRYLVRTTSKAGLYGVQGDNQGRLA